MALNGVRSIFLCVFVSCVWTTTVDSLTLGSCSPYCNQRDVGLRNGVTFFDKSDFVELDLDVAGDACDCSWQIRPREGSDFISLTFVADLQGSNSCLDGAKARRFSIRCDNVEGGETVVQEEVCSGNYPTSTLPNLESKFKACTIEFSQPRKVGAVLKPSFKVEWELLNVEEPRPAVAEDEPDELLTFAIPLVASFFSVLAVGGMYFAYDNYRRSSGRRRPTSPTSSSREQAADVQPGAAVVTHGGVRPRNNDIGEALFATPVDRRGQVATTPFQSGMFAQPVSNQSMFNMRLQGTELPLAVPAATAAPTAVPVRGPLGSAERNRLSQHL